MASFTAVILFLLGLAIGSFLNVVAVRYSPKKSFFDFQKLKGRSKCPKCLKQLKWYELIPLLSFIIQKGRCRNCGAKISFQYFFAEFISGLIFLLPFYFYSPLIPYSYFLASSVVWITIFLIFLLLWLIDKRLFIIPDELNIILAISGFILIAFQDKYSQFDSLKGSFLGNYASIFGLRSNIWVNHLLGLLIGFLIVGVIIILTRGRGMGLGDLKLMGALGLIFGLPDVVFVMAFACLIGSVFSIYQIIFNGRKLKETVPFAPFLVFGAVTLIFFGQAIIGSYFRFFNFI